jgi:hypothetical protein
MIMIPASRVAYLSGAATAALVILVMSVEAFIAGLEFGFDTMVEMATEEMPLYLFIGMPILVACLIGGVVIGSVRLGLFLSGCPGITKRRMLVLVVTNLALITLFFSVPLETHAAATSFEADIVDTQGAGVTEAYPPGFISQILIGLGVLIGVPAVVAFAVGRHQENANA